MDEYPVEVSERHFYLPTRKHDWEGHCVYLTWSCGPTRLPLVTLATLSSMLLTPFSCHGAAPHFPIQTHAHANQGWFILPASGQLKWHFTDTIGWGMKHAVRLMLTLLCSLFSESLPWTSALVHWSRPPYSWC